MDKKRMIKIACFSTGVVIGAGITCYLLTKKKSEKKDSNFDGQNQTLDSQIDINYYSGPAKDASIRLVEKDIVLKGYGQTLFHRDYDENLPLVYGQTRDVVDEEGKVICVYKYVDGDELQMQIEDELYTVVKQGKGWDVIYNEEKEVAYLHYVEDSELLEGSMEPELSDIAKLCILALPVLSL